MSRARRRGWQAFGRKSGSRLPVSAPRSRAILPIGTALMLEEEGILPLPSLMEAWRPPTGGKRILRRSEEHTSELQSLMRISYAVFCLKKKTKKEEYTHGQ